MGNDSRQYGFKVERGAYDLTDFTERLELAHRACQFVGSLIQFFKQPDVFAVPNSLSGERLYRLDLRREAGPLIRPRCTEMSNGDHPLAKWNVQDSAPAAVKSHYHWKFVSLADIGNVERAMLTHPLKIWLINTDLK